jgi:hypothetical protein
MRDPGREPCAGSRGANMEPSSSASSRTWRYGDFPELFWDAKPDAVIDVRNPVTFTRLLTRGRAEVIGKLMSPDDLREGLETVDLPKHVALFWWEVLRRVLSGAPGASSSGEGEASECRGEGSEDLDLLGPPRRNP